MKVSAAVIVAALAAGRLTMWGPAVAAEKASDDEVIATVDGRDVRQSDLDRSYATFGDALEQLPPMGEGDPQLQRYLNFRLIAEAAKDAGLAEDPEVRRTVEQMTDLVLYRTFLHHFVNEVSSEAALRARYDLRYGKGEGLQQVHAHHIRLDDRETAEKVIRALEGGAEFAFLAREHSVARSASEGGDIGFVGPGDVPPAFIEAAFALDLGEFTQEPVETPAGWEVIMVEARRSRKAPPFDEVKEKLARDAVDKSLIALLVKLREQSGLETEATDVPK